MPSISSGVFKLIMLVVFPLHIIMTKGYIHSKRLHPIPLGMGSRIWNFGRCLLEPCWGLLGSKLGVVEV